MKDDLTGIRASPSQAQSHSAMEPGRGRRRWSVRAKLMAMAFVASGLMFAMLFVAMSEFSRAAAAYDLALRLGVVADVSTGLDAGRHAAFAYANEALTSTGTAEVGEELQGMVAETRKREARVTRAGLPADVLQALIEQE